MRPDATGTVRRRMLRRIAPGAATAVAVAAVLRVVYDPWYLNYDARYALLWARDALHGRTPDYTAPWAPTPHPLETAASVLGVAFGDGVMMWIVLLCFGAVVWLIYRLGAELFTPAIGVAAAVVVATRPNLQRDALLGYQDVAFAALILWAVLLEARRARRGWPVMVLLAVAGLMRPEAWLLSGIYVVYCRDWRLLAVAAVAPVLWALDDLLVTGDLLHSLHGTADLAVANHRRTNPLTGPYWSAKYFGSTLREPAAIAVPVGLWLAWRARSRGAVLPLAVAGVMVLVFMAGPLFGLPLIARYVRTPAMLVALFYGVALCGWRQWRLGAAAAIAATIVFLPWHYGLLHDLDKRFARDGRLYRDLQAAAAAPRVYDAVRRCGPLAAADHRPVPYLRWWLDTPPGSVYTPEGGGRAVGRLLLVPRRTRVPKGFYKKNFPRLAPPPGFTTLYLNDSWRVLAAPDCLTRLRS